MHGTIYLLFIMLLVVVVVVDNCVIVRTLVWKNLIDMNQYLFHHFFCNFLGCGCSYDWKSRVWAMASRQGHQRHNLWRNDLCWLLWWGQRLLSGGFWGSSHDRNWGPVDPYRHRVSRLLMCKTRSARYLPPSGPNFRLDLLFHQRLEKQKEEKNTPFDDISYNIIKKL